MKKAERKKLKDIENHLIKNNYTIKTSKFIWNNTANKGYYDKNMKNKPRHIHVIVLNSKRKPKKIQKI